MGDKYSSWKESYFIFSFVLQEYSLIDISELQNHTRYENVALQLFFLSFDLRASIHKRFFMTS